MARWNGRVALSAAVGGIALIGLLVALLLKPASPSRQAPSTAAGTSGANHASSTAWNGVQAGGTWTRTGLSLEADALLADPHHAGHLYAGTTSGIWLSNDAGATWAHDGGSLAGTTVFALAMAQKNGLIVAGAANGAVYANQGHGAGSWRRISPRLDSNPIFSVSVSPSDAHVVLAGTGGALYRGVASGHGWTWRRVARTNDASVTSIAWAPWNKHLAFASVFGVSPPVLATRDDGLTWRPDDAGLPSALPTQALLAVDTPTPVMYLSTMGGGVWRRAATGPWRDVSAGLPQRHAMPLVGTRGRAGVLYAGTMGDGVYVKRGEVTWRRLGRGLRNPVYIVLSLALTSGPHPVLLAGTARGVFRYAPPA